MKIGIKTILFCHFCGYTWVSNVNVHMIWWLSTHCCVWLLKGCAFEGKGLKVESWEHGNAETISTGQAVLGIELGSTRIKACLIAPGGTVLATGGADWENQLVDGHWSYSLSAVWSGLQAAYQDLQSQVQERYQVAIEFLAGLGISAMMHGYLAFDTRGEQLVPFRTWRDTYTTVAAQTLTDLFQVNVPLRWSISHYYQAIVDREPHVEQVSFLTTLAGYVHWQLTGQKVLGIGDAVGMFPVDSAAKDYDQRLIDQFDQLVRGSGLQISGSVRDRLPKVLLAGQEAGTLSASGAKLLDPSGMLQPGTPLCPPEGDAGTGMVATNAVRPRTGNVSVGTSIFAMLVLENQLQGLNREVDPVTTPAGDPVAMVHCNNGAAELATWMGLFQEAIDLVCPGEKAPKGLVYDRLLAASAQGETDGGGLVSYNYLSGEPVTGVTEGRPLFGRQPDAHLNLANFFRTQLYSTFAGLAVGMKILAEQGVAVDVIYGHGGLFRTPVIPQRFLATALNTPVALADSASEGGAWGIALLADFLKYTNCESLAEYLEKKVFGEVASEVISPNKDDRAGFEQFLTRYQQGLPLQSTAVKAWPLS